MKNKILSIALILMLISAMFVLTGCGEEDSNGTDDNAEIAEVNEVNNETQNETNGILEMAENSAETVNLASAKEQLLTAISYVNTDFIKEYVNDSSITFDEYCTSEILNDKLESGYTVNLESWNNGIANGTIEYNENVYEFTLELNSSKTGASVTSFE